MGRGVNKGSREETQGTREQGNEKDGEEGLPQKRQTVGGLPQKKVGSSGMY